MIFSAAGWLGLLPVVAALGVGGWWWLKRRQARLALLSRGGRVGGHRAEWQWAAVIMGAMCLCAALAGPHWGRSTEEVVARSRNVMLCVDVSRSMLAEDLHPNRLGRAKADLIDLIDSLSGDRVGVMAFRGKGVLLCPMTTDRAFLRQSIAALSPESAPPGETNLADAIAKSLDVFAQHEGSYHAIVLISDGEDLAGHAEDLARRAGEMNVPIFTVGLGSPHGAPISIGGQPLLYDGQPVQSRLDEETLRRLADLSGGQYVPLATAGTAQTTLGAIYAYHVAKLEAQEAREQIEIASVDRTPLFLIGGLICLLAAAMSSVGRIGGGRRLLAGAAVLFGVAGVMGQEAGRSGQAAYREGHYVEAAEYYRQARQGAEASEVPRYAYNEALAWQKAGNLTNALARVRLAVHERDFTARAATLEGTLLYALAEQVASPREKVRLREEAVDAFTRALQAEPGDEVRKNLARAMADLPALRLEVRRTEALEAHKQQGLLQLSDALLREQRRLIDAVPQMYRLPNLAERLKRSQELAQALRTQADRCFPVVAALPQAITNETLQVELCNLTDQLRQRLDGAAEACEELTLAAETLRREEPFLYDLWKTCADPPALNAESIAVQTNALTSLASYQPAREDEAEVLALTEQFRDLFPAWAEAQLQQQAASTNTVTFTEADRDLILRTADEVVPLLAPPVAMETKRQVMDKLVLIREHLPKQSQQNNQQPQNQPQKNEDSSQQQDESSQPQTEQQSQPSAAEEQRQKAEQEDLQALLQKAVDREQAHEEKKRNSHVALPPSLRDW